MTLSYADRVYLKQRVDEAVRARLRHRVCLECGGLFAAFGRNRERQRYCGEPCRKRAEYRRVRERRAGREAAAAVSVIRPAESAAAASRP